MKTIYFLDQGKVDSGAIGQLFVQDSGFTMLPGKEYEFSDEFIAKSTELQSALRFGWIKSKKIEQPEEAAPSQFVEPEMVVKPDPVVETVQFEPSVESEVTPNIAPEQAEIDAGRLALVAKKFDLAVTIGKIIQNKDGTFTLPLKGRKTNPHFDSRDHAIERIVQNDKLFDGLQNLLQEE